MLAKLCTFLFVCVVSAATAFGYGPAGHEVVGSLAEGYLQGTRAEAEVRQLMKPSENLAKAATWADRAKAPEQYLSPEMKDFVEHNPDHHSFHYCDVPFQETKYHDGGTGTAPDDIVHIMKLCIAILQNPDATPQPPRMITKRVALLLLAHLVGDIHQPLHVGCSYVDLANKFVDPDKGTPGQQDAGGNDFKIQARTALHGFWDTPAVKLVKDKMPAGTEFAAQLKASDAPKPDWKTTGPVNTWPEKWATETLHLASAAYAGLKISNRHPVPADDKGHPEHDEWTVTLPPGYEEKAAAVVEVELAKAGYRLAELLKAIWPELPAGSTPAASPSGAASSPTAPATQPFASPARALPPPSASSPTVTPSGVQ